KTVAGSLGDLVKGLTLFAAVPGTKKFISFVRSLGEVFEGLDPDKVEKGARGVKTMGISIATLGLSLAASSVLFIVGLPGAIIAATVITGLSFVFERLDEEKIAKSSTAISIMAIGIATVGLSLFLFQKLNIDF